MTDNIIDIAGQAQPSHPRKETVKLTITAYRKDSEPIVQDMELDQPAGTPAAHSILYAWQRINAVGALATDEGLNKTHLLPLGSFEKITIEASPVVGVQLA